MSLVLKNTSVLLEIGHTTSPSVASLLEARFPQTKGCRRPSDAKAKNPDPRRTPGSVETAHVLRHRLAQQSLWVRCRPGGDACLAFDRRRRDLLPDLRVDDRQSNRHSARKAGPRRVSLFP